MATKSNRKKTKSSVFPISKSENISSEDASLL